MKTSDVQRKTDETDVKSHRKHEKSAQSQFEGLFKTQKC